MKRKFAIGGFSLLAVFIAGGLASIVEDWVFGKIVPVMAAVVDGNDESIDDEDSDEEDEEP